MKIDEENKLTTRFFDDIEISSEDYKEYTLNRLPKSEYRLVGGAFLLSILISALLMLIQYVLTDTTILGEHSFTGRFEMVIAVSVFPLLCIIIMINFMSVLEPVDKIVRDYFLNKVSVDKTKSNIEMEYMYLTSEETKDLDALRTLQILSERLSVSDTKDSKISLALYSVKYSPRHAILSTSRRLVTILGTVLITIFIVSNPNLNRYTGTSVGIDICIIGLVYISILALVWLVKVVFKVASSDIGNRVNIKDNSSYSSALEADITKQVISTMEEYMPVHYKFLSKDSVPSIRSISTDLDMTEKKKELDILYKEYMSRYVGGNK